MREDDERRLIRLVNDLLYRLDGQEKAIRKLDQRVSGLENQVRNVETDVIAVKAIRRKL